MNRIFFAFLPRGGTGGRKAKRFILLQGNKNWEAQCFLSRTAAGMSLSLFLQETVKNPKNPVDPV